MGRVTEKLHKKDGASLALALLLFLMCAMVGSVILAAASVSAGRMAKMSEQDSKTYTLTSAADLIGDEICGKTYIYNTGGEGAVTPNSGTRTELNKALIKMSDSMSSKWKTKNVDGGADPTNVTTSFTISVQSGASSKTVTADVTMDTEYNLTIGLREAGSSVNRVIMKIPASPYTDSEGSSESTSSRFPAKKVTWLDPQISIQQIQETTAG